MTANPYLLQLPDPDTSPARALDGGADTFVVIAESSADALALVQNYSRPKLWAGVSPAAIVEATDMSGWRFRLAVRRANNTVLFDQTVENDSQIEGLDPASGVFTTADNTWADGNTVTIGTVVYTARTALTPADREFKIAGTEAATLTNLAHCINNSGATNGVDYSNSISDPNVRAVSSTHTVTVTAIIPGTVGNALASTAVGHGSWGGAHLTGGVDSENKLSTLILLMMDALDNDPFVWFNAFNDSTHVLTVAGASANIGDGQVLAEIYPPSTDPQSPIGLNTSKGIPVPGFVSGITQGGAAGAALTVTFAADTYGVPKIAVKARVQE